MFSVLPPHYQPKTQKLLVTNPFVKYANTIEMLTKQLHGKTKNDVHELV